MPLSCHPSPAPGHREDGQTALHELSPEQHVHVPRTELERFFTDHGPFPVPDAGDADAFWATLRDYYARVLLALDASPRWRP